MTTATNVMELECSECSKKYDAALEQHLCTCGRPLLVRYELKQAATTLTLENLSKRVRTLWRYREVLPPGDPVTLGEGMTPLIPTARLGASMGLQRLYVKDEGLNPTGSFKARGMTAAVTRAKQLGAKILAAPTAGNAGGALAAYAAAAGVPAGGLVARGTPGGKLGGCRGVGPEGGEIEWVGFEFGEVVGGGE